MPQKRWRHPISHPPLIRCLPSELLRYRESQPNPFLKWSERKSRTMNLLLHSLSVWAILTSTIRLLFPKHLFSFHHHLCCLHSAGRQVSSCLPTPSLCFLSSPRPAHCTPHTHSHFLCKSLWTLISNSLSFSDLKEKKLTFWVSHFICRISISWQIFLKI